jgi:hypothetical protein
MFILLKSLPTTGYLYKIYEILMPEFDDYEHSISLPNTGLFFDIIYKPILYDTTGQS